jgi:TBCC domain-containing protein 1
LSSEAASVVIATLKSTLPTEPIFDEEEELSLAENKNQFVFVQDLMLFLFAQTFARPRAQSQLRESGVVLETGSFEDDVGSGSGSVDPMRSFTFGSPTRSPARRHFKPSPKKGGKNNNGGESIEEEMRESTGCRTSLHALFAAHHFNAACGLVVEDPAKIGTGGQGGGLTELTAAEADRLGYLFRVVDVGSETEDASAFSSAKDGAVSDVPAGLPDIPGAPGSELDAARRASSISHRCGLFAGGDRATVPAAALREWLVARLAGARFFGKSKTAPARVSPGPPASPGGTPASPGTSPAPLSTYLPCSTTHASAVIENVRKGTAVRRARDFPADASARVADCEDAIVYLLAPMRYASIVGCTDCVVVVGAVSRAVRVERCRRVTVIAATRRLRVRNARDCVFHLGVAERPVFLGECRGNVVAPYNTFYESLEADLKTAELRVDALTQWSDPQCVFAQREETETEKDRDEPNERSKSERTDRVVERLAPETFAPFIVPFRGEKEKEKESKQKKADDAEIVTQANPFAVPDAYVAALDAKVRAVASLRGALRDARLDEHTKRELQATIQAHFKEWLLASGSMRQVYELARIERGESAL